MRWSVFSFRDFFRYSETGLSLWEVFVYKLLGRFRAVLDGISLDSIEEEEDALKRCTGHGLRPVVLKWHILISLNIFFLVGAVIALSRGRGMFFGKLKPKAKSWYQTLLS